MMDDSPKHNGLAAYITVTAAYWAFMLTDGALRMLVLLHFHTLGFSPVETFETGIAKTLDWYLANEVWWRPLLKR